MPVPDELQASIRRALAKDAAARFPSAEAMIEALTAARQVIGERDSESTVLLQPAPVGAGKRRRFWVVATAAGVAAVALAALTRPSRPDPSVLSAAVPAVPESAAWSPVPPSSLFVLTRSVSESAFAPLRRAALDLRASASQAGAAPAALTLGDSLARDAEGLAALGRQAEAVERLAAATAHWQEARERAERRKAAQPVDVATAAEGIATRLAEAVASRNVERIRAVYPNLASDEHDRWVEFFQSTDSINAVLRIDTVEAQGRRANAVIRGEFAYWSIKDARQKRENVEYRATFEQTRAGWRMAVIRKGLFKK
jgi:hypothetical protein